MNKEPGLYRSSRQNGNDGSYSIIVEESEAYLGSRSRGQVLELDKLSSGH